MKIPLGSLNQTIIRPTEEIRSGPLQTVVSRMRGSLDDEKVALVIEGGGMSGVISGGMSVVLEELGLVEHFDMIVGCSAGSLNASYLAARQGFSGSHLYLESASSPRFINRKRALYGRPIMSLSVLFDYHMKERRPYSEKVLENNPNLYLLAFNVSEHKLEPLNSFQSTDEVRAATRASCTIPGVTGELVEFRDHLYADGGLIESVPFKTAKSLGATQCLILRSRPSNYRKLGFTKVEKVIGSILLRDSTSEVKEVIRERNDLYNKDAEILENYITPDLHQLCPAGGIYLPDTFESSPSNLLHGFIAGVREVKKELF